MDVDIDPVSTPLDAGNAMDIVKGGADAGVTRDKTTPFLIRAFVKVGGFHRLNVFEDGALPTADEHQVFTWKDATLRELLTTLRDTSSPSSLAFAELKHPLARFSFKALDADSSPNSSGHKSSRSTFKYTTKELGMVYSRDILGEPGPFSLSTGATTAPRLLQDEEQQASSTHTLDADDTANGNGAGDKAGRDHDKTLEDLRFVPGDYMLISVILPKSALATPATAAGGASATELNIKGANATQAGGGAGANSSNWRGGSDPLTFVSGRGGRGRGARGGRGGGDFAGRDAGRDGGRNRDFAGRDRDRETDRRPPPPRRPGGDTPPRRGGRGNSPVRRGGRDDSPRRSRSPVPRRGGRARSRSLSRSRVGVGVLGGGGGTIRGE
ncbi:Sin3 associated polypeptide p18-domain-containing protein [Coprinopsis sp. MPI-PUGE-AT-0042]|nr:Sin3 associated polypeptide p18-domain-containing protein [Coprinopsis sp. MPI-PUGE-AT-0042]